MLRSLEPERIFALLVAASGITHLCGAPTVLLMLAEAEAARGVRFDPPIRAATGGSPPSPTLLGRMEELGIAVTHLYGLTETYGPHAYCEMQPGWERLGVADRAARDGAPGRRLPALDTHPRRRFRAARRARRRRRAWAKS